MLCLRNVQQAKFFAHSHSLTVIPGGRVEIEAALRAGFPRCPRSLRGLPRRRQLWPSRATSQSVTGPPEAVFKVFGLFVNLAWPWVLCQHVQGQQAA